MSGTAPQRRLRARWLDYVELMKPELTGLSVLTSLCGFYLAMTPVDWHRFVLTGVATFMIGGGLGALNQVAESVYDGAMKRTERRPLPGQRMRESPALWFGLVLTGSGLVILQVATSTLAAVLGAITIVSYLQAYTPLKRSSWLATLVGGVPGALPPMIGWAAAAGHTPAGAWMLFGILYFWQIPHFLSLAWMYKKDYARAGFRALPVDDTSGRTTGIVIVLHMIALIPVSAGLWLANASGPVYAGSACVLGGVFLATGLLFYRSSRNPVHHARVGRHARTVFFASLAYLPLLMALMVLDKV